MKKSIFQKMALLAACMGIGLSTQGITAQAAGTVYNSPYVQLAPDGQAWMFKQDLPDMISGMRTEKRLQQVSSPRLEVYRQENIITEGTEQGKSPLAGGR